MKIESPKKTEIFLLLALKQSARLSGARLDNAETNSPDEIFTALVEQLPASEVEKIERLQIQYQNKSAAEQHEWRGQIEDYIRFDESFIDENIHQSHIEAALQKELAAIRRIVKSESPPNDLRHRRFERNVRQTFAAQFVSLRDLSAASAFDYLNGTQLARLIRSTGIREVALACVRITAVESVAAFLRQFSAEDARAMAAQLSGLSKVNDERLSFAETLVQTALEAETKPSAMLDLLGIRLVGLLLCGGASERIAYTAQKLPLEIAPMLVEIIETQCRQTPVEMRREISAEIERLAETTA